MDRWSRLSRRFGTLRWQLTFSYFMTALVALLLLEGVFVGIPSFNALINPPAFHPVLLAQGLEKLAPQVAPYVARIPPDRAGLSAWLRAFEDPVATYASGVGVDKESTFSVIPGQNAMLQVVNVNSQVIMTVLPSDSGSGNLTGLESIPETRALIANALVVQTDPEKLAYGLPDGRVVAVAPIKDTGGVVHGALVLGADLAAIQHTEAISGLRGLAYGIIPFSLIASVLGALIGILMARGLTHRLDRLTTAADAWSQGDFAITVRDSSADEVGKLARDLNHMAEHLQNLLRDQQQLAVIEERNRLARDLHDSVKQQVFAVKMLVGSAQLEVGDNSEARRLLVEAERISGNAQQELTALIHALRPVALSGKALTPALRELCSDWSHRTSIAVEVQILDGLSLEPVAEGEIFRTVQEALANVAQHSGATRAEVSSKREGDQFELCIQDNGHGFNVALANQHGVGLRSIRERIEGLGGTALIFSGPEGTRIEVSLPLTTSTASSTVPRPMTDLNKPAMGTGAPGRRV